MPICSGTLNCAMPRRILVYLRKLSTADPSVMIGTMTAHARSPVCSSGMLTLAMSEVAGQDRIDFLGIEMFSPLQVMTSFARSARNGVLTSVLMTFGR